MSRSLPRDRGHARLDQTVAAKAPWSTLLRQGEVLRIVDVQGQQAVDTLLYNAHDTAERYSGQDTLVTQAGTIQTGVAEAGVAEGAAYITTGSRLLSNEGRLMATVVADSCGRHDTSAGACSCEANTVRFGHHTRYMHACRENFILEGGRYGLTKRDLVGNINFFMNVPILPNGDLAIDDGVSEPGSHVELRAEMDVIVLISNCPQVNNPCNGFDPTPIRVLVWADDAA